MVELVHLGGHTSGSCGFLDHGTKSLFTGDDLLSMRVGVGAAASGKPYAEYRTVSALRTAFERLSLRKAEFSHVYPGHFATDLENATVDAMLEACSAICADPKGCSTFQNGAQLFRAVDGLGTIAYTLQNV